MPVRIGNTLLSKVFSGNNEITKIFVGNTLIYENIDADAQSFITAASITNPTQITAIDTLVKGLKTNGIWSKMKAIYPFVGGTANSHKFNLKDTRDLDAAFRLQFFGGITHDENGIQPNGVNSYGETFLISNTSLLKDNKHLSYYSRTNSTDTGARGEIGSTGLNNSSFDGIFISQTNNQFFGYLSDLNNISLINDNNRQGFYVTSRLNNTQINFYKNGNSLGINPKLSNSSSLQNVTSIRLGVANIQWSIRNCAFASIGDGLTDSEATNFYNIVQAYQTTLNRQV